MTTIAPWRIIDARGPYRKVTAVNADPHGGATLVTMGPCGHVGEKNQIYTYRVGDDMHCFQCREASDNLKPEA